MNYSAMIENRKSVRAFTEQMIPYAVAQEIKQYYDTSVKRLIPELPTELHLFCMDVKAVLEGAAGYNQFLVGAPQYMVLLSEKHPLGALNAGYIMEDIILNLTDMGLDSCWVTFTDSELIKESLGIESEKDVMAIVAFGYGIKTSKRLRLNIKSMSDIDVSIKRQFAEPKKSVNSLVFLNSWGNSKGVHEYIGFFDDMLWESFHAVAMAPSYLNRQAYGFVIRDGQIFLVRVPDAYTPEHDEQLSLGIALLHFNAVAQNWAGSVHWNFGSAGVDLGLPEGHRVIAFWHV